MFVGALSAVEWLDRATEWDCQVDKVGVGITYKKKEGSGGFRGVDDNIGDGFDSFESKEMVLMVMGWY